MKIHLKGTIGTANDEYKSNELWLNGKKLSLKKSLKVRNHSPTGFNWGYAGSGCAQSALAICIELFGKEKGCEYYQNFKFKFIGGLPFGENFDQDIEFDEKTLSRYHQEEVK